MRRYYYHRQDTGGACWYEAPQYRKRLTGRIYSVNETQVEPCSGQIISGRQPGSFTVEFACGGSGRQIPRVECKRIGGYPLRPRTLPI
jgi:hypothetical protein